jgi:hypothetical protein
MDYVLVAPFGFALIVAAMVFAHSRQFGRIAARVGVRGRRAKPSFH